jgi:hypothetical protein
VRAEGDERRAHLNAPLVRRAGASQCGAGAARSDRDGRVILDIDSSESPVHGAQEQAAYKLLARDGRAVDQRSQRSHSSDAPLMLSVPGQRGAVTPAGHRLQPRQSPGRLVLPLAIQSWSLTSLQQRLFKTFGRLIRHARYFVLQLAESHLTSPLFSQILRRIERLAWHPT